MNSQGWIRGYMTKSYSNEKFLKHVVSTISRQLKVWDENYHTQLLHNLLSADDYSIIVQYEELTFQVDVNIEEVRHLQAQSIYGLDQFIWRSLAKQGLVIGQTNGNYLTYCDI